MTAMRRWLADTAEVRERRGIIRRADRVAPMDGSTLDLASNDYL
jgi:hypothetical protein